MLSGAKSDEGQGRPEDNTTRNDFDDLDCKVSYKLFSRNFRSTFPPDDADERARARVEELNALYWDLDGTSFVLKKESFHEKPTFAATVGGITWVLFYHDARDGPQYHGWWVTQSLGEKFLGMLYSLEMAQIKVLLFSPDVVDEPDKAVNWLSRPGHSYPIHFITQRQLYFKKITHAHASLATEREYSKPKSEKGTVACKTLSSSGDFMASFPGATSTLQNPSVVLKGVGAHSKLDTGDATAIPLEFQNRAEWEECRRLGFDRAIDAGSFRISAKSLYDDFKATSNYRECRALGFESKANYDAFREAGFEFHEVDHGERKLTSLASGDRVVHDGRIVQVVRRNNDGHYEVRCEANGDERTASANEMTPLHPAKLAHEDCLRMGFFYKKHYDECRSLDFEAKTDFDEFRRMGFKPTLDGKDDYWACRNMGFEMTAGVEGIRSFLECKSMGYPLTTAGRLEYQAYKRRQEELRSIGFDPTKNGKEEYEVCKAMGFPLTVEGKSHFDKCTKEMHFPANEAGRLDYELAMKMTFQPSKVGRKDFDACLRMGFEKTEQGKRDYYTCKIWASESKDFTFDESGKSDFDSCRDMGFTLDLTGQKEYSQCKKMGFRQTLEGKADFDKCRGMGFKMTTEDKKNFDLLKKIGFYLTEEGRVDYERAMLMKFSADEQGRLDFYRCQEMGFLDASFRSKDQIVNGRHHFNACREMGFEQSIDGMKMYFLCKSMMFPATPLGRHDFMTCMAMGFAQNEQGRQDYNNCTKIMKFSADVEGRRDFTIAMSMKFDLDEQGRQDFIASRNMGFEQNESGREDFLMCKYMGFDLTVQGRLAYNDSIVMEFDATKDGKLEYDAFILAGFIVNDPDFHGKPKFEKGDKALYDGNVIEVDSAVKKNEWEVVIAATPFRKAFLADLSKLHAYPPARTAFENAKGMGFQGVGAKIDYLTCRFMGFSEKEDYDECVRGGFITTKFESNVTTESTLRLAREEFLESRELGIASKAEYERCKADGYLNMKRKMKLLQNLKRTTPQELEAEFKILERQKGKCGEENWKAAFDSMTKIGRMDKINGKFYVDGARVVHPVERVMDEFLSEMVTKNARIETLVKNSNLNDENYSFEPSDEMKSLVEDQKKFEFEIKNIEMEENDLNIKKVADLNRRIERVKQKIALMVRLQEANRGTTEFRDILKEYRELQAVAEKENQDFFKAVQDETIKRQKAAYAKEMERMKIEMMDAQKKTLDAMMAQKEASLDKEMEERRNQIKIQEEMIEIEVERAKQARIQLDRKLIDTEKKRKQILDEINTKKNDFSRIDEPTLDVKLEKARENKESIKEKLGNEDMLEELSQDDLKAREEDQNTLKMKLRIAEAEEKTILDEKIAFQNLKENIATLTENLSRLQSEEGDLHTKLAGKIDNISLKEKELKALEKDKANLKEEQNRRLKEQRKEVKQELENRYKEEVRSVEILINKKGKEDNENFEHVWQSYKKDSEGFRDMCTCAYMLKKKVSERFPSTKLPEPHHQDEEKLQEAMKNVGPDERNRKLRALQMLAAKAVRRQSDKTLTLDFREKKDGWEAWEEKMTSLTKKLETLHAKFSSNAPEGHDGAQTSIVSSDSEKNEYYKLKKEMADLRKKMNDSTTGWSREADEIHYNFKKGHVIKRTPVVDAEGNHTRFHYTVMVGGEEIKERKVCDYDTNGTLSKEILIPLESSDLMANNLMARIREFATKTGGVLKAGPQKGEERCIEKVTSDYDGNWNELCDLERATAIYPTPKKLSCALAELIEGTNQKQEAIDNGFTVVRVKDRMNVPASDGSSVFISVEAIRKGKSETYEQLDLPIKVIRQIIKQIFPRERAIMEHDLTQQLPLSTSDIAKKEKAILEQEKAELVTKVEDTSNLNDPKMDEEKKELRDRITYLDQRITSLQGTLNQWGEAWSETFKLSNEETPQKGLSKCAIEEVSEKLKKRTRVLSSDKQADLKKQLIKEAYLRQTARRYCSEWLPVHGSDEHGMDIGRLFKVKDKEGKEDNNGVMKWVHAAFGRCDCKFSELDKEDVVDGKIIVTPADGSLERNTHLPAMELVEKLDRLYLIQDSKDIGKKTLLAHDPIIDEFIYNHKEEYKSVWISCMWGGYRDILLNVRHDETKFVGELQLTLKALLDKKKEAHATYEVKRTMEAAKMIGVKKRIPVVLNSTELKQIVLVRLPAAEGNDVYMIQDIKPVDSDELKKLKPGYTLKQDEGNPTEAFEGTTAKEVEGTIDLVFEHSEKTPTEKKEEENQNRREIEMGEALNQRLKELDEEFESNWETAADRLKRDRFALGVGAAISSKRHLAHQNEVKEMKEAHDKALEDLKASETKKLDNLKKALSDMNVKIKEHGDDFEIVKPQLCCTLS